MVQIRFTILDDLIKELKANNETTLRVEMIKRVDMGVINHYFIVVSGLVKKNTILKYETHIGSCVKNEELEFEKSLVEKFENFKKEIEKEGITVKAGIYET
ncbi:MAG: hypothetical protein NZ893_01560 [Candidatus Aenigmarchaeota archaeon]|nr:hypothetical protein [Candidatus Aenigmarchaeota archaeon]